MNKKSLLLIILLSSLFTQAQNLVPNPSFEDTINCNPYGSCPNDLGEICIAKDWAYNSESPDYFNCCSQNHLVTIPFNFIGYQNEINNKCAYSGIFTKVSSNTLSNYREMLGVKLIAPLILGQKYYVSMSVSLADSSNCSTNRIGVLFTTQPQTYPFPYQNLPNFSHIFSTELVLNSLNWQTIAGTFVADSAYAYALIGNFFDNNHTDSLMLNRRSSYCSDSLICCSYYYVDDLCVSNDSGQCFGYSGRESIERDNSFEIFPNPTKSTITINSSQKKYSLKIFDILGNEVYTKDFEIEKQNIELPLLNEGIYIVKAISSNFIFYSKLIIQN